MYLLVIFFALLAGRWLLLPGYFNMHDDLQMMRQLAMDECFRDLQIPCRWTPHMGYGYGFPLFNYYPPLPYLFGEIFRLFHISFVNTVKLTFLASFIFSGLTMYIFARQFWGRLGGFLSSVFYIWAPYHAVDIYVRGALNEAWALAWFPLILWSSYRLIKFARFRYVVILALGWFGLFSSHNLMVIIFTPLFAVWLLFWLARTKSWVTTLYLGVAGIWGLSLAAFFSLPAVLEQSFVHVETLVLGYYEYIAHFANVNQLLFSRFWGYGASVWMATDDKMSFQVGHLHWILSLVIFGLLLARLRYKNIGNLWLISLVFFAAGWFATFMAQSRSTPIWLGLDKVLRFVQFPWRFLTLSILSFSFLSGAIVWLLGKRKNLALLTVMGLIAGLLFLNKDYFKPEKLGPLTDEEKFSGAAWDLQQTAGIYDYLPKDAKMAPKGPQKTLTEIQEGSVSVSEPWQNTNAVYFKVNVLSDKARIRLNIFKFPNWMVFVDGQEVSVDTDEDDLGRMHIQVSKGDHEVRAKLYNTPVRTISNTISVIAWLGLLTNPLWRRKS